MNITGTMKLAHFALIEHSGLESYTPFDIFYLIQRINIFSFNVFSMLSVIIFATIFSCIVKINISWRLKERRIIGVQFHYYENQRHSYSSYHYFYFSINTVLFSIMIYPKACYIQWKIKYFIKFHCVEKINCFDHRINFIFAKILDSFILKKVIYWIQKGCYRYFYRYTFDILYSWVFLKLVQKVKNGQECLENIKGDQHNSSFSLSWQIKLSKTFAVQKFR